MGQRTVKPKVARRAPIVPCLEPLEERRLLFAHPGLLNTQADFDRMAAKVSVGAQPWAAGYNALTSDGFSQTGWTPRATQTVVRGGDGQNFAGMVIDMQRAYQTAVRWKISGNTAYADQAVTILNAWSSTMTTLTGNADRFLASGLYGFGWATAADIMRTYSGWAQADVTKFQNWLVNIYYPMQHDFLVNHNGAAITNYWANWDLANVEGMMAVGIFSDRQDLYDEALNYLYTGKGNGALDKAAYYRHPGNLFQWQESGRDQGHTILGMALSGHIAQMAWNNGTDLFSYNNNQLLAAAEYVAKYNLGYDVPYEPYEWGTGQSGAWSQQPVVSNASRGNGGTGYALILGHYAQMLGMAAPYSSQRVAALGTEGRNNGDDFGFGTLTFTQDGPATPQAPRGLTAVEKGSGNIELDWFGGANDTSYKIYRSTSINGAYSQIASGITDLLSYTDRNLPAGVYYYRVTGISGTTETAATNVVSASSLNLLQTQLLFDESSGTTASDATGNGYAGTLNGGATWTAGKTGNAVSLDGSSGYVSFSTTPAAELSDFTIATWVNLNTAAAWSRIFDFGDTRGRWMYLTPKNGGGVVEFATSTVYGYNKQWVTGSAALPTNQWVHVAITFADHVGTLYVNGVAVGSNANMDFPPFEIGSTPNNWIGRSQFSSDPYLNGKVDDFRVYRGALLAGQVYQLATSTQPPAAPSAPATLTATPVVGNAINLSWSAVSGATSYSLLRSTTSGGPYRALATLLTGTTYSDTGLSADLVSGTPYYYSVTAANNGGDSPASPQASATALPPAPSVPTSLAAKALSASSISLNWVSGANNASYTVRRSTTAGGPYAVIASGVTATTYTDTGRTVAVTYYYVVSGANAAGESANSNEDSAAPTDLFVHLKFDETSGTSASDSSGNGWNGTLINSPTWTSSGRVNAALTLASASSQYVTLPTAVVSGQTTATLAAWVYLYSNSTWARIFDFGTGTSNYMFLAPVGGSGGVRFAITTSGNGNEQQINGTAPLPTAVWTHVAVTLNGGLGILYVNGNEVGRKSNMTLNPSSLGTTTLNYLGKSQFSDPYLNGRIDDLRVYAHALSASEVQALATTAVPAAPTGLTATAVSGTQINLAWSAAAGAMNYHIYRATSSGGPFTQIAGQITATSYQDANLTAGLASGTTYYYVVGAESAGGEGPTSAVASATIMPPLPDSPTTLTVLPAGTGSLILSWDTGVNAASYDISRATSAGGPYTLVATGVTATTYTDTGLTNGVTYFYIVTSVNASGQSVDPPGNTGTPTDQFARLKFDETTGTTAADSSGHGFTGTLTNGPAWFASGRVGRAVDLDGTDDYVSLATGVVNGLTTATIAAWVNLDANSTWSRLFDFGTSTTNYMFLTTRYSTSNFPRFALNANNSGEQQITSSVALTTGTWAHLAVVLNGSVGTLYLNGVQVGQNTAMTLNPASLGNTTQNYIGKSQFADPYYNGRVDDFRIYSRALSAAEVNTLAGTTAVTASPAGLSATPGDSRVALTWSAASGAASYTVKRADTSGGPYATIAGGVASTSFTDVNLSNDHAYFYVITSANFIGESGNSNQAVATPAAPVFVGAAGNDLYYVRRTGANLQVWIGGAGNGSGNPNYSTPFASVTSLQFSGDVGNDLLTIEGADAFPAGGIVFNGGAGDDTLVLKSAATGPLTFNDAAGNQTITLDGGGFTFATDLAAAVANATLNVGNGAAITLGSTQHLAGVSIDNATLNLAANGSRVLSTAALSITNGGKLDINDNKLMVRSGDAVPVAGFIATGRNGGAWTGAGIVTGMTAAHSPSVLTTLGVATADDLNRVGQTFAGETLASGDVMVMYTYSGDADMNGRVNGDDYFVIDSHVNTPGASQWVHGDFDYNGRINGDDYFLIDSVVNSQGLPL